MELKHIEGVTRIRREYFVDSRGHFQKLWDSTLADDRLMSVKQVNISHNLKRGTLRGLHYQKSLTEDETKMLSVISGSIIDIALDVRMGSPTFGMHVANYLSEDSQDCLVIENGFAHGFQTLTDNTTIVYLHSASYQAENQVCINALDSELNIDWPFKSQYTISDKDRVAPKLKELYEY